VKLVCDQSQVGSHTSSTLRNGLGVAALDPDDAGA